MEGEELQMTDAEFDLLDELYFVQPFDFLKDELGWKDEEILDVLTSLQKKDWIKCFSEMDIEVYPPQLNLEEHYKSYLYLASKKGLMAHNGR